MLQSNQPLKRLSLMYHFCCKNCQYSHQFQNYQPGQQVSCPRCQTPFTLPGGNPSEAHAQIDLRLEILEKIGEGGMGLVFRARDKKLGREGALKVLRRDVADEEQVQRFFREARITARLDHPTIPPVYQVGQTVNGDHFILMKLISGRTLQELLFEHHKGSPEALDQRQLLEVLIKVSYAVEYAHQHDIIHRDLKPDNIMVGEFGDVTLMDWGIAKDIESSSSSDNLLLDHPSSIQLNPRAAIEAGLTVAGSILGTPGFMSPEQVLDSSDVGTGTDIYALGAVLSEILTGFPPVNGASTMDKMINTMKGQLIYPSERSELVPDELDRLVRSCLVLDQRERIQSASELISELSAYLASEESTISGDKYSRGHRAQRPTVWIALAFSCFVLALTFAFLLVNQAVQLDQPQATPTLSPPAPPVDKVAQGFRFMREAELEAKRGDAGKMREKLEGALELEKSEERLIAAARLSIKAGEVALGRSFLKEVIASYPPAYQALYELHILEIELSERPFRFTDAAKEIIDLATSRNELEFQNPYVLAIKAVQEQDRKNDTKALEYHDQAIQLESKNPSLYLSRAHSLLLSKQLARALSDYNKVIELAPTARNYTERGVVLEQMGDLEKALEDHNQALKLKPGYSRAYTNRGFVYLATKRQEKAFADFGRAIELGAHSKGPYIQRAAIFLQRDDLDSAVSSYTKAIRKFPESGQLYFLRGKLLRRKKQYRESLLDLKRAVALLKGNNDKARAYNQFGVTKFSARDYQNALVAFNQAIKYNSNFADAYYNRGYLLLNSGGDKKLALADYNRFLKFNPNAKIARFERAKLYASLNQKQNAYKDLSIFVKKFPNEWDGHFSLGQILTSLGRYGLGLKSYNRAIQLNSKNLDIYFYRATVLFLLNRDKDALADLNGILDSKPNYLKALYSRSQVYFRMKKYREAIADLTLHAEKTPNSPKVYESRGKVYQEMGQYRKARRDFEKVLQLQPNHPKVKELRGKIAQLMKLAP